MLTTEQVNSIRQRMGITPQPSADTTSKIAELDKAWGIPISVVTTKQPLTTRVSESFDKGVTAFNEADKRQIEGKQTGIETVAQKFGTGLKTAGDVAFETVRSIPILGGLIDKATGAVSKNVQDYIEADPTRKAQVESALNAYNSLDERTKANLGALFEITSAAVGGGAGKAGTQALKTGIRETAETVTAQIGKQTEKRIIKSFDEASNIIKPTLTPTEKELALKQGRVTTSGIFRKTTVKPDVVEQRTAESVQHLVQEGRISSNALPEKNIEEISREVSRVNSGVREFVADNKVPFNEKQLRAKLKNVSADNKIVFASDPTLEKISKVLEDTFVNHVKNKDTLGLFKARQTFDQIPAIKKLLESEKLGENVKRQLVLDLRSAANDYISDLLPANNPYKPLLKQESYMLRAIDNIAESNKGRIDTNVIQRLIKENPWLKYAVGTAIGGSGAAIIAN